MQVTDRRHIRAAAVVLALVAVALPASSESATLVARASLAPAMSGVDNTDSPPVAVRVELDRRIEGSAKRASKAGFALVLAVLVVALGATCSLVRRHRRAANIPGWKPVRRHVIVSRGPPPLAFA